MIDANPNNNYKTKKNFKGFYAEVDPFILTPFAFEVRPQIKAVPRE